MTIDETIAKMISDVTSPLLSKIEAQNKVLVDLAESVRLMKAGDEEMGKKLQGILDWISGHSDTPPPTSPPPTSPPPTTPSPTSPPPTNPPPAINRTREEVTAIIVQEFAKQTSFLPGGGDIVDPNKAIGLWTTNLIDNYQARTIPEASLRALLKDMVAADVKKYQWDKNYPPLPPSGPVISGTGDMPK